MKALIFGLAAVAAVAAGASEKFTARELSARYYYDLGPEQIDVSGYPWLQRQQYQVFAKTCSQCHTLARPINAPWTSRKDWKRFVERMHVRETVRTGDGFFKEEGRHIVDFLAYDAQIRKEKNLRSFAEATGELKAFFKKVEAEQKRLAAEDARIKASKRAQGPVPGLE